MFSPVSMHPKVARALVNLARAPPGGLVYDPFCGTGGLLLEAGLVDARVLGSDIDPRMVKGTERNLDHFGVKTHTVFACDVGDAPRELAARLPVPTVDAIVTDMPYGRSATTKSEKPDSLYARAFAVFGRVLKRGGRAVVGLPTP
jgi:tRNA (guanine10-N2)-dimethyltransferase